MMLINFLSKKGVVPFDTSLIGNHSQLISVTTNAYIYPRVRVFYRAHPKASLLPPKLPLVVFIHGSYRSGPDRIAN